MLPARLSNRKFIFIQTRQSREFVIIMNAKKIFAKIDAIRDLPTLPVIALEVNKLMEDADVSINQVSTLIERDPSIAMKILKLVNSAFYGYRSSVNTLSRAIMLLGFNTVRNAILSVSVINAFSGADELEGFNPNSFWRHSISVAVASKRFAELTRMEAPDNGFIGGLVHDIGKVILAQLFKDLFIKVWTLSRAEHLSFYAAEKKVLAVDHAMIGSHLAKKWALPLDLVDVIRCHHVLRNTVANYRLLVIVHLADLIVNNHEDGAGLEKAVDISASRINPEVSKIFRPHLIRAAEWYPDLMPEIEAACSFFIEER